MYHGSASFESIPDLAPLGYAVKEEVKLVGSCRTTVLGPLGSSCKFTPCTLVRMQASHTYTAYTPRTNCVGNRAHSTYSRFLTDSAVLSGLGSGV